MEATTDDVSPPKGYLDVEFGGGYGGKPPMQATAPFYL
jgi:hypothetical protein